MAFTTEEIRANRDYFAQKLRSEKQRNEVLHAVEAGGAFDFVLLDTRGRDPFAAGHISGAFSSCREKFRGGPNGRRSRTDHDPPVRA